MTLSQDPYESFMRKHLQHYGYYSDRNALVRRHFVDGRADGLIDQDTSGSSSDTSEDEHDEKIPLQYKGVIRSCFKVIFEIQFSYINQYTS